MKAVTLFNTQSATVCVDGGSMSLHFIFIFILYIHIFILYFTYICFDILMISVVALPTAGKPDHSTCPTLFFPSTSDKLYFVFPQFCTWLHQDTQGYILL